MTVKLQPILGVDKRNPYFTLCREDHPDGARIHVFFGLARMEVIPENRNHAEFKILIARLYNAKIKAKSLKEAFGTARTTMKRWGVALSSGNSKILAEALSGQGAPKKLTPQIEAFIRFRFPQIYDVNRYDYSKQMREEIKKVFDVALSSEGIRPLLAELKKKGEAKTDSELKNILSSAPELSEDESPKRANACDLGSVIAPRQDGVEKYKNQSNTEELPVNTGKKQTAEEERAKAHAPDESRKLSLAFYQNTGEALFCHHLGVLVFSEMINDFHRSISDDFTRQLLVSVLLGAKNIEQTKLLDFDAIKALLGKEVISNLREQRYKLSDLATQKDTNKLINYNGRLVDVGNKTDFYFDPHTKHYTGAKKILKGWCSNIKSADKIINMDFIHSSDGYPVFVKDLDNYDDVRVRFHGLAAEFRDVVSIPKDKILTFVADRGIYSFDVFSKIISDKTLHIITWEKGYKKGQWTKDKASGAFSILKVRNNSKDLLKYDFSYIDGRWAKNNSMRKTIVQATNPKGNVVEVSILSDDLERSAEEIIELMFSRWIQENDFRYLDQHFGINEITSYDSVDYEKLVGLVNDKQVKSGEFKALELNEEDVKKELKESLYKKERQKSPDPLLNGKIKTLSQKLDNIQRQKSEAVREESKLDVLIKNHYKKLQMGRKLYFDAIKIIARNMFYLALDPFKTQYDNYRDDHVIFRNLTQSHGKVCFGCEEISVSLYPTAHHQKKVRLIIDSILRNISSGKPKTLDGSGRTLNLKLGEKRANYL